MISLVGTIAIPLSEIRERIHIIAYFSDRCRFPARRAAENAAAPLVRLPDASVQGVYRRPVVLPQYSLYIGSPDPAEPDSPQRSDHPVEAQKADNLHSTVIITERFAERRAQHTARQEEKEMLEPGTRLGRYLIINHLGGGGMGVVYKAHDTELNRTVALKILPPHLCRHQEYLNRFRAEAQAQARFMSPHVITLYSLMELPAGEVLVLEYVDGQTLENRIRRQGPLPISEAVRIFDHALRGVEHIHEMGVVHRDLKPSNIFLTRDESVKLMDFGVARIMDGRDAAQQGTMVGTLLYISPEQINGRETDFRSDIYTLGVSLFEAITGRLPFERRSDYALMHAHVQETPPRPKQFKQKIPTALEWVILKAIEKEPDRRFQSAAEFRVALLKLGLIERRHKPAPAKSAAAGLLPDTTLLRQEWMRYRLAPRPRLLGGLWLDVGLVAMVLGLVFALGLYPAKINPPPAKAANAAKVQKTTKPKIANTAAKTGSGTAAPRAPKPARDKYESLRKAWGE
jgi:serine/threonine-protein kinase